MKEHTEDLCDSIDAAIFSGDEFLVDAVAREELRAYMARWERGLKEHEETANTVWCAYPKYCANRDISDDSCKSKCDQYKPKKV